MNAKRTDCVVPLIVCAVVPLIDSLILFFSEERLDNRVLSQGEGSGRCFAGLDVVWQFMCTHATAVADGLVLLHREVTGLSSEGTKFDRLTLFCLLPPPSPRLFFPPTFLVSIAVSSTSR